MQNRFAREFTLCSIGPPLEVCTTLRQDDSDCLCSYDRTPVSKEQAIIPRPGFTLHAGAVACTGYGMRPGPRS